MNLGNQKGKYPIIQPPPIENFLELERCFLTKLYEKNRDVFKSLVVCHYRFLIDTLSKLTAIGEKMNEHEMSLRLRDNILASLSTYYKIGEDIGYISRIYWEHCYDHIEPLKGPPRLFGFFYPYTDSLKVHRDFCAFIIRETFKDDNFYLQISDNDKYAYCCKMVRDANTKKGIMKKIELKDMSR